MKIPHQFLKHCKTPGKKNDLMTSGSGMCFANAVPVFSTPPEIRESQLSWVSDEAVSGYLAMQLSDSDAEFLAM